MKCFISQTIGGMCLCMASLRKCTSVNECELINNNTSICLCKSIRYWFVTLSATIRSYLCHECVEIWIWQFISSLLMLQTNRNVSEHSISRIVTPMIFGTQLFWWWIACVKFKRFDITKINDARCTVDARNHFELMCFAFDFRISLKFQWKFFLFAPKCFLSLSLSLSRSFSSIKCVNVFLFLAIQMVYVFRENDFIEFSIWHLRREFQQFSIDVLKANWTNRIKNRAIVPNDVTNWIRI